MNNIVKFTQNNRIKSIIVGCSISIISSLIMLLVYATILVNSNLKENTIDIVVIVITSISILIGSSICSMKIKKNGIINGVCVGGIYLLILYILSSIFFTGFSVNLKAILTIIVGFIIGGIGGIIGVNRQK